MIDLSVLIPARREEWLKATIDDVLAHAKGPIEVIAVLDGEWADPGIPDHPQVTLVKVGKSIGQRAATNLAARLAQGRYVMKLDAHCAVADGFDVELVTTGDQLGPDVTQIPAQKNLHVYSWFCTACDYQQYQGPPLARCPKCQGATERRVVWQPRPGTTTMAWSFDSQPKFQYGPRQHRQPEIADTMSSLGACFVMRRERFFELGGLEEAHGSWGSFGLEVACKSWLSGGRHVTNRRTWFSHFFRVGGVGFPYEIHGSDQEKARAYAKQLWFTNSWPGQVRPLKWLVEKFWPLKGWTREQVDALPDLPQQPSKGVVYYSDNRPEQAILNASRRSIEASGLPIVAVTLGPIQWPAAKNIVFPGERGVLTMFRQILAGLEALDTEFVFFCEHDVIYPREHFQFTPPSRDRYYYDTHTWKVDADTGRAVTYETKQTSGLCADRQLLIQHYRERIARVERDGFSRKMGFEPGSHRRPERVDDVSAETWRSSVPLVDIRHGTNLTASRWSPAEFRDQKNCQGWQEADAIPGWGVTRGRFAEWLAER